MRQAPPALPVSAVKQTLRGGCHASHPDPRSGPTEVLCFQEVAPQRVVFARSCDSMIERYREVVTTTEPSPGCPARVFFRSTEMIMSVADIPIDFFGGDVRADIVRDVLTAALSRRPLGFEPMEVKL